MYDWEIRNFLKDRNYILTNKEYIYVCRTCPQINQIKYNSYENNFEVWTDYNYFKFQVYYKED